MLRSFVGKGSHHKHGQAYNCHAQVKKEEVPSKRHNKEEDQSKSQGQDTESQNYNKRGSSSKARSTLNRKLTTLTRSNLMVKHRR